MRNRARFPAERPSLDRRITVLSLLFLPMITLFIPVNDPGLVPVRTSAELPRAVLDETRTRVAEPWDSVIHRFDKFVSMPVFWVLGLTQTA